MRGGTIFTSDCYIFASGGTIFADGGYIYIHGGTIFALGGYICMRGGTRSVRTGGLRKTRRKSARSRRSFPGMAATSVL